MDEAHGGAAEQIDFGLRVIGMAVRGALALQLLAELLHVPTQLRVRPVRCRVALGSPAMHPGLRAPRQFPCQLGLAKREKFFAALLGVQLP
ncbi:hypothetical protein [Deinococcus peraridilitoris]|uniref:hypothetical protein n=1 Tax=Deinococcus peraridilitoris TaxID=432329 RepID=UPI0012FC7FFC|nr:hypothetical protein [Deinococcus peraridilitoris]